MANNLNITISDPRVGNPEAFYDGIIPGRYATRPCAPGEYELAQARMYAELCRTKCAWHWGVAKMWSKTALFNARKARVTAGHEKGYADSARAWARGTARAHLERLAEWRGREIDARAKLAECVA